VDCPWCGAAVAASDQWCPKCTQPLNPSEPGVPGVWNATRRKTRWQKTSVTFGPVGRLLWTTVVALPVPGLLVGFVQNPGPRGGAIWLMFLAVWVLLVMPWILRDIWRAAWLPAEDDGRAQRKADLSNLRFPGAD